MAVSRDMPQCSKSIQNTWLPVALAIFTASTVRDIRTPNAKTGKPLASRSMTILRPPWTSVAGGEKGFGSTDMGQGCVKLLTLIVGSR